MQDLAGLPPQAGGGDDVKPILFNTEMVVWVIKFERISREEANS